MSLFTNSQHNLTHKQEHAQNVTSQDELSRMLNNYAELLIAQGIVVKEGQEVVIDAPLEAVSFVRRVVLAAYRAGAGHVTINWGDDELRRLEYENVELSYFEHTPSWKREQMNSLAEQGACYLQLTGSDPSSLAGIDPAKPVAAARSRNSECNVWRHGLDFGHNAWCIAGVPVAGWSRAVFPEAETDEEANLLLWKAILAASRATGTDPLSDWRIHDEELRVHRTMLNELRLESLHYSSSNGTDLSIGLPQGHLWGSGCMTLDDGRPFQPNIPTEEVFTSPDRMKAEGIVYATMPLVYQGSIIRELWVRFEKGRVVEHGAAEGAELLGRILDTDEGARRLGEVALIAKDTPIRESGLLFYNTLFDENASCHVALGMGFAECQEGGVNLDEETLLARGVNQSHTHLDFMIGADDLTITGVTPSGEEHLIFCDGLWAL